MAAVTGKYLSIGQLAQQAGVNVTAVRYYERCGLLPRPARSNAGYRAYLPDSVARLRFIQRGKQLGFTLDEIAELLSLNTDPATSCTEVRARAAEKVADIELKVERLERIRTALKQLMDECPDDGPVGTCPILAALDEDAER